MAESVVNPQSAAQLKSRNAEPTHLSGASWTDIGGRKWDDPAGADSYKVDAANGVGTDTSIPKSVAAEPSHLTGNKVAEEEDKDEVEIEYDGEKKNEAAADELDKELDESDIPAADVKVDVKEADDDDDSKDDKKEFNFDKKKDEDFNFDKKKDDDGDKDDKDDVKEAEDKDDDKGDDKDDKKNPFSESVVLNIKMPKATLFESAGFTGEQQKRVAAIFESAIKETTKQASQQLREHYSRIHKAKLAEAQSRLEARVATYLDVVVEEWMKSNEVAVRQTVRTEMSESFLNGLQQLFKEHYIDVPEGKVDVVEALSRENDALKKALTEETAQKMKLRRLAEAANKKRIVAEFARNLSEGQAAKLEKLAEDTAYVSAADFRAKLTMLKESYFEKQPSDVKRLPAEDVPTIKEEKKVVPGDGEVDAVVDAISRQVKSTW